MEYENDITASFDIELDEIASEAIAAKLSEIRAHERQTVVQLIRKNFMPICLCGCGNVFRNNTELVQDIINTIEKMADDA